jgi:hypothetical protein
MNSALEVFISYKTAKINTFSYTTPEVYSDTRYVQNGAYFQNIQSELL